MAKKTKFEGTPGIWGIAKNGIHKDCRYTVLSYMTNSIANVYCKKWPKSKFRSDAEAKANANLIAAAPDLLDACISFINAPHYQNFALSLNDDEYKAYLRMKEAVEMALNGKKF